MIAEFMRDNAIHHLRSFKGDARATHDKLLRLRGWAVCARTIEVGDPSYRTIKGIPCCRPSITTTGTVASTAGRSCAALNSSAPAHRLPDLTANPEP